jgi:hypothetical protein
MTTEELENKIKEFVEISEKQPESYRTKCFEILLDSYLAGEKSPSGSGNGKQLIPEQIVPVQPVKKFVIPIDVRAFLQQYNLSEEIIQKLFLIEGEEIRLIYSIKTTKKADAQMQIALLTALENTLRPNGKFEFSMEDVRHRCDEHKVLDKTNFKNNFKNNKKLFKELDDKEDVELSPDGKAKLADVILDIGL